MSPLEGALEEYEVSCDPVGGSERAAAEGRSKLILLKTAPTEFIPLYRPYLGGREKEYVLQCIESSWISSKGAFVEKFENAFAGFVGAPHVTSVCNGTVALHLALETLGFVSQD